jgi:MYXO-CTERM domain-containing protein
MRACRAGAFVGIVLCALPVAGARAGFLEEHKFTAPDGASEDFLGFSASVSGDKALVGAYRDDDNGNQSGSAYLFDTQSGGLLHKLTAPDGAEDDEFGRTVAISGNNALIGAHNADALGTYSGAAYLFDADTGNLARKLTAPDGTALDRFGAAVAISGNDALIGAWAADNASGVSTGAAYLFAADTGALLQKLTPPDGAAQDSFGGAVAIGGGRALIGAIHDDDNGTSSGSAYLFDTGTGSLLHKLTAPDGAEWDYFGYSVALSGSYALVGAAQDDDDGDMSGSAYLFDVTSGNLLHKLTAPDGAEDDFFGGSVAIDGADALIGATGHDKGSAYLFDALTGDLLQKLTASDTGSNNAFGSSVSLGGDQALIGAQWDRDNGFNSGAAYLFIPEAAGPDPDPLPVPATPLLLLAGLALLRRRRTGARHA